MPLKKAVVILEGNRAEHRATDRGTVQLEIVCCKPIGTVSEALHSLSCSRFSSWLQAILARKKIRAIQIIARCVSIFRD